MPNKARCWERNVFITAYWNLRIYGRPEGERAGELMTSCTICGIGSALPDGQPL